MALNNLAENISRLCELSQSLDSSPLSSQLKLISCIYDAGFMGHKELLSFLLSRRNDELVTPNGADGLIFELLLKSDSLYIKNLLSNELSQGVVSLRSDANLDYLPLQLLLSSKKFQDANVLTHKMLIELSCLYNNHSRQWLYFTDIIALPSIDLRTIDQLWQVHSLGLFGISVQKKIWLANKSSWDKFFTAIAWTASGIPCRYPQEFIWDTSAPAGHLPLFNQLRGTRVMHTMLMHPAWQYNIV